MIRKIIFISLASMIQSCGPQNSTDDQRSQQESQDAIAKFENKSLTGESYKGKKYYFGWGAAGSGDPSNMQNEVKYDVIHTNDIFTKKYGGNYIGEEKTGSAVSASVIKAKWNSLNQVMTQDDMYVQYSSGHGSEDGLGVGVDYSEIADQILKMKGKEIIVFIMACHSGGLVDQLNQRKAQWQDWQKQGRTLFVMASSPSSELSSTGPGTDSDEPAGADGTAGSAFGYSLWKSLIGYSDGAIDGVKDGYVSLGEIVAYTKKRTQEVGGHTPVYTGVFNPNLIINRVPPKSFVSSLEHSTEGMSDEQIKALVMSYDQELAGP